MHRILSVIFILSWALPATSQDLTATHTKIPVTDIVADAWTAPLNDDISFYKDTFADFTKQEFGEKAKNDGKTEMIVERISLNRVSDKRGDLRLNFITEGSETKLALSFLLGYDIWINPEDYPDGMEQLRLLTRDYLRYHYTEYYNEIIDQDLKLVNGHKKDIDRAERSIANMRRQITKNEERLSGETNANRRSNLERKNQRNREDIDRLTDEIPQLREKITALDEHIQHTKTLLQNVEAQYFNNSEALSIPEQHQFEPQDEEEPSEEEYEDLETLDDIDDYGTNEEEDQRETDQQRLP